MKVREDIFYEKHYNDIKKIELQILNEICNILHPINQQSETKMVEYTTSRVKTPESTMEKLELAGYAPTEENALSVLSDVIGIRLVVHFIGDIYTIRNILVNSRKLNIVKEKDYVRNAKPSGYRGYHIIIEKEMDSFQLRAEIQIRTIAMDCWASLEHQLRYKKVVKHADLIDLELKRCSDDLMSADIAMEQILGIVKEEDRGKEYLDDLYDDAMACATQIKQDGEAL